MKVTELLEKYNKNSRIDLVKALEVKTYTSIMLKRKLAKLVLDNCTTVVDGEIHIDSVEKYILFTIAVIGMHTNLEFSDEEIVLTLVDDDNDDKYDVIDAYDALCESGLLVKIIDTFKDDYIACQEVLNMMTTDKLQDSMTIEKKIGKFLDGVQDALGKTIGRFADKLDFNNLLDNLPVDQNKLLELYRSNEIKK